MSDVIAHVDEAGEGGWSPAETPLREKGTVKEAPVMAIPISPRARLAANADACLDTNEAIASVVFSNLR